MAASSRRVRDGVARGSQHHAVWRGMVEAEERHSMSAHVQPTLYSTDAAEKALSRTDMVQACARDLRTRLVYHRQVGGAEL